jgi:hypothetical protein
MLDMLRRGTQDTNKEFSPADIDVPQTIGVAELEDTLWHSYLKNIRNTRPTRTKQLIPRAALHAQDLQHV